MTSKRKQRFSYLEASSNLVTYYLNETKTSWIKLVKLQEPDGLCLTEFEELWKIKPSEKRKN